MTDKEIFLLRSTYFVSYLNIQPHNPYPATPCSDMLLKKMTCCDLTNNSICKMFIKSPPTMWWWRLIVFAATTCFCSHSKTPTQIISKYLQYAYWPWGICLVKFFFVFYSFFNKILDGRQNPMAHARA